MEDKRYTSNIEGTRLSIEEAELNYGHNINPHQIWRDGKLIPGSPDECTFSTLVQETSNGEAFMTALCIFHDGQKVNNLVKKVVKLPLTRVTGTLNSFKNVYLKNIIGREFDQYEDESRSWQWKLYDANDNELAYGMGDPYVDSASGTITFRSSAFCDTLTKDSKFYISFYKYVGRTGFFGSDQGIGLPFRDDLILLKDADSEDRTALFRLYGDNSNTVYILPKPNLTEDNVTGLGYVGRKNDVEGDSVGVIVLEENFNDVSWEIGKTNGGLYHTDGSITKSN